MSKVEKNKVVVMKHIKCYQWAILILRLTLGFTFILHGGDKLLNLNKFLDFIVPLGVNKYMAYLAVFAEFIGGILMFIGFLTEIGALLVIPVMIGAIFVVHGTSKYFIHNQGFEYPFVLILLLIALIISGPGKFALWDPFDKCRDKNY